MTMTVSQRRSDNDCAANANSGCLITKFQVDAQGGPNRLLPLRSCEWLQWSGSVARGVLLPACDQGSLHRPLLPLLVRRPARPAACRRSTSDLLILRPTQGLASKNKGELTLASSNRRARLAGMRPPFESGLLGLLVWAPISHPPSGPPAKNPLAPPSPRALAFLSSSPFITTSDRERPSPLRPPHFLFRPSVASFQLESIPLPHLPFTHRLPVHSLFFFRPGVSLAFSFLRPTLL